MRRVLLQMGGSLDGIVAGGPEGQGDPGAAQHQGVKAWKAFPTGTVVPVYRLAGSTSR